MFQEAKEKMRLAHTGSNNHRWKGGVSRKRNPQKILAKRAVNHAIEAKRLAPAKELPCFDCGEKAREYDHYWGYKQPHWLDVQAVCVKCHRRRHKTRRKTQSV